MICNGFRFEGEWRGVLMFWWLWSQTNMSKSYKGLHLIRIIKTQLWHQNPCRHALVNSTLFYWGLPYFVISSNVNANEKATDLILKGSINIITIIKNIATGETSQAITPFHFYDERDREREIYFQVVTWGYISDHSLKLQCQTCGATWSLLIFFL